MPDVLKCASCLRLRPPTELLAFWPADDPARRRFVCRPTLGESGPGGPCFRAEVGSRAGVSIGLA